MSLITLSANNQTISVINALVDMPLTGVWTADLVIDQIGSDNLNAGDSVTIQDSDQTWQLKGTVIPDRNKSFLDAVHVRVLGGAAGMAKSATPKAYQKAIINDVIKKLMSDSGETLDSSTSDSAFLNTQLPNWSVFGDNTTASAIENLINKYSPKANWRIQQDGKLFIGTESYPDLNSNYQYDMLEANPIDGTYTLGVTTPQITPGLNIPNIGHVSRVRHEIFPGKIRSSLWVTLEEQNRTVQNAISNIVDAALPAVDYLALYGCTVKSQSSDFLTLDITPDDSRLPGMSSIPYKTGLAGATAQIDTGCKVLLGWENGDISKPFVSLLASETAQKIILTVGGTKLTITSSAVDVT